MKKPICFILLLVVSILLTCVILPVRTEAAETKITYPNGGETLFKGGTYTITWEGHEDKTFQIHLSIDSGATYDIYIGSGSGGSFVWTVPDISTDRARIKVTGLIQYFTHFHQPYTVVDTSDADFSIGRLPAAPTDLNAVALSDSEIRLTWTDNADNETAFWLERVKETEPGVGVHPIDFKHWVLLGEDIETFTDSGLDARSTYTYKVRAFNAAGYSDYSNEARATTFPADFVSPVPKTLMRFNIGNTNYYVDGLPEIMDTAPIILEGRTLLPIRYVADPLGALVRWDPGEQKVTIMLQTHHGSSASEPEEEEEELIQPRVVELWIGQNRARVNGVYQYIDPANHNVVPVIVPPGRTMLPLRFIAEALGCSVGWDPKMREATITWQQMPIDPWGKEMPPHPLG